MHNHLLLWLLLGVTLASLPPNVFGEDPIPTEWPPRFYALLYQNYSGAIGIMDLYYDWELGMNLHLIKNQYQTVIHDLHYQNGTILRWEAGDRCRQYDAGVGLLPPNWFKGATYNGTQEVDGFSVHVWTKVDFITYREDIVTKRPISWTFYTGRDVHVLSFNPGYFIADEIWNVPANCFLDDEKLTSGSSHAQT